MCPKPLDLKAIHEQRKQFEYEDYYAMKTPTQEQLNSVEWWKANDPSDGEATHFDKGAVDAGSDWPYPWLRLSPQRGWQCWDHPDGWTDLVATGHFVERPNPQPTNAKPESQEWVDGLPPVGERVEYDTGFQNWCPATVIAKGHDHSEEVVVIQTTNRMFIVDAGDRIRPLKTDAEREKEETIGAAQDLLNTFSIDETDTAEKALSKLYDAGMLCKGGES